MKGGGAQPERSRVLTLLVSYKLRYRYVFATDITCDQSCAKKAIIVLKQGYAAQLAHDKSHV